MTFIDKLKENTKAWEEFERWYKENFGNESKGGAVEFEFWIHYFHFEMQSGVFIAFLVDKEILNIHYNVPISKDALQMFLLKSFELLEKQLQRGEL